LKSRARNSPAVCNFSFLRNDGAGNKKISPYRETDARSGPTESGDPRRRCFPGSSTTAALFLTGSGRPVPSFSVPRTTRRPSGGLCALFPVPRTTPARVAACALCFPYRAQRLPLDQRRRRPWTLSADEAGPRRFGSARAVRSAYHSGPGAGEIFIGAWH
jgi:hypothetical protein